MKCFNCGATNPSNAYRCESCNVTLHEEAEPFSSPLVWAILATVFCCLPFGVVAIVYSVNAKTQAQQSNMIGAGLHAQEARKWIKWSVICWFIAALFGVVIQLVGN